MSQQPTHSNHLGTQKIGAFSQGEMSQAVLTFCLDIPAGVTPIAAMESTILAALGPQAERLVRWAIVKAPINATHWQVAGAYLTK
jgi:hypothetical protein